MSCVNAPTLVCSGCKAVAYCGKQCQRDDWPAHKLVCYRVGASAGAHLVHHSSIHLRVHPGVDSGWHPVDRDDVVMPSQRPVSLSCCGKSSELVCAALDAKLTSVVPDPTRRTPVVRALGALLIQGATGRTGEVADLNNPEGKRVKRSDGGGDDGQPPSTVTPMETSQSPTSPPPSSSSSSSSSLPAEFDRAVTFAQLGPAERQHIMLFLPPEMTFVMYDIGSPDIRADLRDPTMWSLWYDRYPHMYDWYEVFAGAYRGTDPNKKDIADIMLKAWYKKPEKKPLGRGKFIAPHREGVLSNLLFYGRFRLWFTLTGENKLPDVRPVIRHENMYDGFHEIDCSGGRLKPEEELGLFEMSPALPPNITEIVIKNVEIPHIPVTLPRELQLLDIAGMDLWRHEDVFEELIPLPETIRELNLRKTNIRYLPHQLPAALINLNLSNNDADGCYYPIDELPKTLLTLDISGTHVDIGSSDVNVEDWPPRLQYLTARWMDLVSPENLPLSLKKLDITGSGLLVGTTQLTRLTRLTDLVMSSVAHVPEHWPPQLSRLYLSRTELTQIPKNLPVTLTLLDMRGTKVPLSNRVASVLHADGTEMKILW